MLQDACDWPAEAKAGAKRVSKGELGAVQTSLGEYAEAEESFRRLRELEPGSLRGTLGMVEVYLAQKRDDDAIALLQAERKAFDTAESHSALAATAGTATTESQTTPQFDRICAARPQQSVSTVRNTTTTTTAPNTSKTTTPAASC